MWYGVYMEILLFWILGILGVVGIAIAAFVAMVFLEAAFAYESRDVFDLEEEDF